MFRGSYQRKLLTILQSGGSNPLEIWSIQVKNGWTRRLKDDEMGTIVFEIAGTNVATAYIVSPPDPKGGLGISLPFITMIIKNLKRYFTFEIQILDDKQMRRRFRFSNYQSSTKVRPFTCSVPLSLKPGWNQMQLNLANFTSRAYGTNYMETQRVQIHANCRIRRVFFSDRLYTEEELPRDYRVYLNAREAMRTEPPKKILPHQPSQKLHSASSKDAVASPILSQTVKAQLSETNEDMMKETSFKSIYSVDRPSLKSGNKSKSLITLSDKSTSKTSVEKNAEEKFNVVSKTSSVKSVDPTKVVTFTLQEVKEGSNAEESKLISEQLLESQPETPRTEPIDESTDADTHRSGPTESEYAESEPIPESDNENTLYIQPEQPDVEEGTESFPDSDNLVTI